MSFHGNGDDPRMAVRSQVMANGSLLPLKVPAFQLLDTLQGVSKSKAVQLDALFLTATLVAQGVDIDPHELISRAKRQIREAATVRNPHLEAIREFAAGELK